MTKRRVRRDILKVKTWHVLGEDWNEVRVAEIDAEHSGGMTVPDRSEIRLPKQLDDAALKKRLAHELTHIIGFDSEDAANAAEALVGLLIDHGVL